MRTILYECLIKPGEILIEVLFTIIYGQIKNVGASIIIVSVVVNTLLLPIYRRADLIQEAERYKQDSMARWIRHIRKTFRGDEQYMMVSAYYKECRYHPVYALKGLVPLIIQMPFFIGAYQFLSHCGKLAGESFLHIASFRLVENLRQPDRLFHTEVFSLNILPIIMTIINLMSSSVYLKGRPIREKIQQWIIAIVFLILLYDSPAGLVLYWTTNNTFSLIKNLVTKKRRKKPRYETIESNEVDNKGGICEVLLGGMAMALLTGAWIPSAVISASPLEFVDVNLLKNPVFLLLHSETIAIGIFVIWGLILYVMGGRRFRQFESWLFYILPSVGIINFALFGRSYGILSANLVYDQGISIQIKEALMNGMMIMGVCLIMTIIRLHFRHVVPAMLSIVLIGIVGVTSFNINSIVKATSLGIGELKKESDEETIIEFSRTNNNVIVFMLDRGIGALIPYIFAEKPELTKSFDGFTFYPNTISFGGSTRIGSPALFGGYEYTPVQLNIRFDERMVDKHNEALKVMPSMFYREGYQVTICDPPYAGYKEIPDLAIFNQYPKMKTHITTGRFRDEFSAEFEEFQEHSRNRNFFFYGLFRVSPLLWQEYIYDKGKYLGQDQLSHVNAFYLQSYPVLENLSKISRVTDEGKGTFLMMANDTTHGPSVLQLPDYTQEVFANNSGYNTSFREDFYGNRLDLTVSQRFTHYCAAITAYERLGEWFEWMRENDIYDNTRIIITSDHGYFLEMFPEIELCDVTKYNPVLFVKDFYSTGFRIEEELMTNAETPWLAMQGVVSDMSNPFTGRQIQSQRKSTHIISGSDEWWIDAEQDYEILDDGNGYYSVKDNIYDAKNWARYTLTQ